MKSIKLLFALLVLLLTTSCLALSSKNTSLRRKLHDWDFFKRALSRFDPSADMKNLDSNHFTEFSKFIEGLFSYQSFTTKTEVLKTTFGLNERNKCSMKKFDLFSKSFEAKTIESFSDKTLATSILNPESLKILEIFRYKSLAASVDKDDATPGQLQNLATVKEALEVNGTKELNKVFSSIETTAEKCKSEDCTRNIIYEIIRSTKVQALIAYMKMCNPEDKMLIELEKFGNPKDIAESLKVVKDILDLVSLYAEMKMIFEVAENMNKRNNLFYIYGKLLLMLILHNLNTHKPLVQVNGEAAETPVAEVKSRRRRNHYN